MSEVNDLFVKASRSKLRFSSVRGDLTVEQLWTLPLSSKDGFNLDAVARAVNAELKGITEESFVETRSNPRQRELTMALDIAKFVIATIQTEEAERKASVNKALEIRKIRDALAAKEDEKLTEATSEELLARLAELNA